MEWFWNIINRVLAIIGYETSWELISDLFSNHDSYEPFASWANYEINWGTVLIILFMAVALLVLVAIKTWQLKDRYQIAIMAYKKGLEKFRAQTEKHLEDEKFGKSLQVLEEKTRGDLASLDPLEDIRGIRRRLRNFLIMNFYTDTQSAFARAYAWDQVYRRYPYLLRRLLGAPRYPKPPSIKSLVEPLDTPRR